MGGNKGYIKVSCNPKKPVNYSPVPALTTRDEYTHRVLTAEDDELDE
jgi:hypothetical protein